MKSKGAKLDPLGKAFLFGNSESRSVCREPANHFLGGSHRSDSKRLISDLKCAPLDALAVHMWLVNPGELRAAVD